MHNHINHVEVLRSDTSEFVDPQQAADELIEAARIVKDHVTASMLPIPSDVEDILRLDQQDHGQVVLSVRNLRRNRLKNVIDTVKESLNTTSDPTGT